MRAVLYAELPQMVVGVAVPEDTPVPTREWPEERVRRHYARSATSVTTRSNNDFLAVGSHNVSFVVAVAVIAVWRECAWQDRSSKTRLCVASVASALSTPVPRCRYLSDP